MDLTRPRGARARSWSQPVIGSVSGSDGRTPGRVPRQGDSGTNHNPQPMLESPENRPKTSDAVACIPAQNRVSEVIQRRVRYLLTRGITVGYEFRY